MQQVKYIKRENKYTLYKIYKVKYIKRGKVIYKYLFVILMYRFVFGPRLKLGDQYKSVYLLKYDQPI